MDIVYFYNKRYMSALGSLTLQFTFFITHSWYPYVMLVTSVFLLVTIAIYTYFQKLLNFYTRIMRHFAFSLFVAFVILSLNQMSFWSDMVEAMDEAGNILCKASGKASAIT